MVFSPPSPLHHHPSTPQGELTYEIGELTPQPCPCCGTILNLPSLTILRNRLTQTQRKIFDLFLTRPGEPFRVSSIVLLAYSNRDDGGPLWAEGTVRVVIYQLKNRIRPYGWGIRNHHGYGYSLHRLDEPFQ